MNIDKLIKQKCSQSRCSKKLALSQPMCEQRFPQQKNRNGKHHEDAYRATNTKKIITPQAVPVPGSPGRGHIRIEHLRQEDGNGAQQKANFDNGGKGRNRGKTKTILHHINAKVIYREIV